MAENKTPQVTVIDPVGQEKAKLRVAAYARVSSDSADQLNSYLAQVDYYTRHIGENPDWELADLYADKGITGTSAKKRPEFLKMIRDAEKGKIDLVITKSVSRFTRNTLDGLEYVRRLKRCGVGVYFEKENTNTLNMSNEMILTFMMSQAQSESESLSTNVKWGFRKRFQDGVVYYHYDSFLGYREGADGEPEIDPDQAQVVRRIFARYLMGQSVGQICRGLTAEGIPTARGGEKWCDTTVRNILQNEKYIGDALLQKTFSADLFDDRQQIKNEGQLPKYYVHECHPAIIDRDIFQRVQEEMARRSSLRKTSSKTKTEQGKYSGKYAFGELLVCSECGSPYRRVTYMPRGQKRYVWRCINRLEHGTRVCRRSATMEEPELQAAVATAMNQRFQQQGARQALEDCVAAALVGGGNAGLSLPMAEARLRALQERQMELLQLAAVDMDNTEFDGEISRVSAAIVDLLTRKTELEREGQTDPDHDSRVASITGALEEADSAGLPFDDTIVRQVIGSIKVLDRERLSIRFKDGTEVEQVIECAQRRASA